MATDDRDRDGPDRPLVGEHPYVGAARERAHPTPTADPQLVADLDRLQLAERSMADAVGAGLARVGEIGGAPEGLSRALRDMLADHRGRADRLGRLVAALGGAPSTSGPEELPEPAGRIGDLGDTAAIAAALASDARALVDLGRAASSRLASDSPAAADVAGAVTAGQADAARLTDLGRA